MRHKCHLATATLLASSALLAACGQGSDTERLARLGLPPASYQADAGRGAEVYSAKCRDCHGPAARGSDKGPPLVHGYYVASHHADLAFYRAVKQGVVQHHWEFGDMPAQPDVAPERVADIIAYVRGLQAKQGLR
ncbi:MAG: c-type cytochrome [Gammaproteobacteria bacterium]|jgi:mono/diheme cytochrome c family protein|nr:c-type cytochrome [Gammaproteobacteria bacterium]